MRCHQNTVARFYITAVAAFVLAGSTATAQTTTRVSVSSSGEEANNECVGPRVSADGRYVVFVSRATNLIAGGTSGLYHVYVHDALNGATALVSVNEAGEHANDRSDSASISADGRFVAFQSDADNLVTGDTNGYNDVFVRDVQTGQIELISVDTSGAQGNHDSFWPTISADAGRIVFSSLATNLVSGPNNGYRHLFVRDRLAGTTVRVSVNSSGEQANADCNWGRISSSGGHVAFSSGADNLVPGDTNNQVDVFVHDLQAGHTARASVSSLGVQGNQWSDAPAISGDGRYAGFASYATNLIPGDTNNKVDIFVRDLLQEQTTRVNVSSTGEEANSWSTNVDISADGRYVLFASEANNLVTGEYGPWWDVYAHDRDTGTTIIASVSMSGGAPDQNSGSDEKALAISADGAFAVFESLATNLVPGDTNGFRDIFLRELSFVCNSPVILEQPVDQAVCSGEPASFTVVVGGTGPLEYQWRKDGVDIPGATEATYSIEAVTPADAGEYDVVVSNPCGSVISTTATLYVDVTILEHPQSLAWCVGGDVTFSVTAVGVEPLTYQWRKDGAILPGRTQPTLSLVTIDLSDSGDYDVVVTNPCGSLTSELATLVVQEPVIIVEHPQDQTACEGDTVTFSAVIEAVPPLTFYWRVNGQDIFTPGPEYTIESVTLEDAGSYQLFIVNSCGVYSTDTATLAVPEAPSIVTHPESREVCQGVSVTFTVVAEGGEPLSYQWRKDGVEIPGATEPTYTIEAATLDDAGDYDAVVTNVCGEAVSDPATLTVTDDVYPTIVQRPGDLTVCVGGDATFEVIAEGTNLEYRWQQWDDGLQEWVDIPGATNPIYTIESVTLEDSGTHLCVWVSNECTPEGEELYGGDATLLVDDGVITFLQQPIDQTGCETASAAFHVVVDATWPVFYQWRHDGVDIPGATNATLTLEGLTPFDAGAYDVVVTTTCGTATSNSATLTVIPYDPPVITTQPVSQVACEGGAALLVVEATGAPPLSYQWRKDAIDIPGATGSTYLIDPVTLGDVGSYDVLLSNSCAETFSDVATFDVTRLPIITRQPADRIVATGEGVTFVVGAIGAPLECQWLKDGSPISGATASTHTIEPVEPPDQGEYAVVVTNACGPVGSDTVTLTLVEPPRTTRPSVSSAGAQARQDCDRAAVSADGRYVAFVSRTATLVRGVDDEYQHVFVRDRQSGTTIAADMNLHGFQTKGDTLYAVMSRDERWIAYESDAFNVVPGDTNDARDVFLLDKRDDVIVRISAAETGEQGNGNSGHPSVAFRANYVAYHSDADNLVSNDTNAASDVFVYDRLAETLTRVSVSSAGAEANGDSRWASISDDGRIVAFESAADNLVPDDTNGVSDIFVHDRQTGQTIRASVDSNGAEANGACFLPAFSGDGSYVAFHSAASNLVADDTNGVHDVFVHDLMTGTTILVSRADGGMLGNGDSSFASLSGSGRHVAFLSRADNLVGNDTNGVVDVFVHDRDPDANGVFDEGNQVTFRASVASNGFEGNAASAWPMVAYDGTFVVFQSAASNLVDNDTNGCSDVFRHRFQFASTSRVSIGDNSEQANGASGRPSVSGGQYVLFACAADNLTLEDYNECLDIFSRNIQMNETEMWTHGWVANGSSMDAVLSADGRSVAFESLATNLVWGDNPASDVFVHDMQTGLVELVSVSSAGEPGNNGSYDPAISADGRYVAFISFADNLVPEATGGAAHVFVRDRQSGTTFLASVNSAGEPAADWSYEPAVSADGRFVAFGSAAANLVPSDTNGKIDIFVRDTVAETTTRVSVASDGTQANDNSSMAAISGNGRIVAFTSWARNLFPGDNNDQPDIFAHDRQAGETHLVSVSLTGGVGNDGSGTSSVSFDGRFVSFDSGARDLVLGDDNFRVDVFARDMVAEQTTIVSVDDNGIQGLDGDSSRPAITMDGRYVAFESEATNLVLGDTNGRRDIFTHDRAGCLPPFIIEHPVSQTVFIGQRFFLMVVARGTVPLEYQWRKDGVEIPGATQYRYEIESATPEDAGLYDVIVSNGCGTVVSDVAEVIVEDCAPYTSLGSAGSGGLPVPGAGVAMSADGRYFAFADDSGTVIPAIGTDIWQVYVYDRQTGGVICASLNLEGHAGTDYSRYPALSPDGRFVVFCSHARDLVPDPNNRVPDVFVRDRDPDANGVFDEGNAVTYIASVSSTGEQGNASSGGVLGQVISADGRMVVFYSQANDLVPGGGSFIYQIYTHDRQTLQTARVSETAGGVPGDDNSFGPRVTPDGRYIVYFSAATNLVANDTNGVDDVFLHDRQTGATTRVSLSSSGEEGNRQSRYASVSDDGRLVAFGSDASNLVTGDMNGARDIFVRDIQSGQTTRISIALGGAEANGPCYLPRISGDGRLVSFYSDADNLVPNDTNGFRDAFIHDLETGQTTRSSVNSFAEQGNEHTGGTSGEALGGMETSPDGRYLAFYSRATNFGAPVGYAERRMYLRDRLNGLTDTVSVSGPGVASSVACEHPAVGGEGRFVAFTSGAANLVPGDTNNAVDVFVHDRLTLLVHRANLSALGEQAGPGTDSGNPTVSADGRYVAFFSSANNLVPGDTNDAPDVFVKEPESKAIVLASRSSGGELGNGDSGDRNARDIALTETGRFVAFASFADNLVPSDTNNARDIFVRDRDPDENGIFDEGNGETTRVSVDSAGNEANRGSETPAISPDGRFVAFRCDATNLHPLVTMPVHNIYVHDRVTGQTNLASLNSNGVPSFNYASEPTVSADGNLVAFRWPITGDSQVYLRDRANQTTTIVSVDPQGQPGNGSSEMPSITPDGLFVVFAGSADNLVANDTNGFGDVFLRDLSTATTIRASLGPGGIEGDGSSSYPAITPDAGTIAFRTAATNLVPGVALSVRQIAVRDRTSCAGPEMVRHPGNQSPRPGKRVTFDVVATGNPPPTYEWRKDGVAILGAAQRTYSILSVGPGDVGTYDVVVTNFLGSVTSEPATLSLLALGDLNCDGQLDAFDIDPFVLALTDPDGYAAAWPDCDINLADCNDDGTIDAFDIDPFVELLTGG